MKFDYAATAATAARLIDKFGRRAYLRKRGEQTGTAYDPAIDADMDHPITVVDLDRRIRDRDGTLIEGAGRSLIVSTDGLEFVTPEKGDAVMIGPGVYPETMQAHEIAEVRPLSPGGVVVIYEIDLAR